MKLVKTLSQLGGLPQIVYCSRCKQAKIEVQERSTAQTGAPEGADRLRSSRPTIQNNSGPPQGPASGFRGSL